MSEKIISRNESQFLDFLKSLFIEFSANIDQNAPVNMEPYDLESRLLRTFPKTINVVSMKGKKIVKPYNGILLQNDLNDLEDEDVLDRAVLILRRRIHNIDRERLPRDLTPAALIKGECKIPQSLINFYSKIISKKYPAKISSSVERFAKSFLEDLSYAVTNGTSAFPSHRIYYRSVESCISSNANRVVSK